MKQRVNRRHMETYDIGKRKSHAYKWLVILFIVLLLLAVPFFMFQHKYSRIQQFYAQVYDEQLISHSNLAYEKEQKSTLLLIGTDHKSHVNEQATYLMHYTFEPENQRSVKVSIPRKLSVTDNFQQLDQQITIGEYYGRYGAKATTAKIEKLLQVNYNYVVILQFDQFRQVVDEFDEMLVKLDQPVDVFGEKFNAQQTINLSGRQTELLLTYIQENEEDEYQARVQNILSTMMNEGQKKIYFWRLDTLLNQSQSILKTNVPFEMFRDVYLGSLDESLENVAAYSLDGERVIIDHQAQIMVDETKLNFIREVIEKHTDNQLKE